MRFTSDGSFEINGRGLAYAVRLDRDTDDFAHLLGKEVEIDGVKRRCIGVERFTHSPPWYEGEAIGLLVEGDKE